MAVALIHSDSFTVSVRVGPLGTLSLDAWGTVHESLMEDWLPGVVDGLVHQVEVQLAAMRYLAEPIGRRLVVRQLSENGGVGSVLWRLHARPADTMRVLRPHLRDRSVVAAALAHELWTVMLTGSPLPITDVSLELVDVRNEGYRRLVPVPDESV